MKIKITILTENDIPASALNGIDEEQIKSAWQALLDLISVMPAENNDRATVLSAEFVEEEGEAVLPSAHSEIEERKEESAQNVPKEDLISRKAAIDALDCINGVEEVLRALPSAQPEPQWIPVSERLPEVGKDVMVCYDFKGHRSVLIGVFYGDEKFHGYDDEYLTPEGRKYRKAVAWKPLPEPYQEDI